MESEAAIVTIAGGPNNMFFCPYRSIEELEPSCSSDSPELLQCYGHCVCKCPTINNEPVKANEQQVSYRKGRNVVCTVTTPSSSWPSGITNVPTTVEPNICCLAIYHCTYYYCVNHSWPANFLPTTIVHNTKHVYFSRNQIARFDCFVCYSTSTHS